MPDKIKERHASDGDSMSSVSGNGNCNNNNNNHIQGNNSSNNNSNISERKFLSTTSSDPPSSLPSNSTNVVDARWCMDCNKKFTSVQRKHRCRVCNNVFCADCSPRRQPAGDKNGSNRVCHSCFPRVQTTVWVDDTVAQFCMNKTCGKAFTGIRRRHHCRVCGLIFCLDCCPKAVKGTLPKTGVALEGHARVCLPCLGYPDGVVSSTQACSKCTVKFSVTKRRHHCRRCEHVFCNDCCPKSSTEHERICAECQVQDKLSDAEVLKRFETHVVQPSSLPHVQTGLRELPLVTKRALVSLYWQSTREPNFALADDPSFWGCILGTESKSPACPPTTALLQRLRVLLAAAEDSWVEDLIDLTGLSPLTSLLTNPDLSLQISALACITGLATTRTGLQAVVTSSELAEAVVTMLLRATNTVKIACLDLLTLLCWSSPQGRQAVVEGFSVNPPKYKVLVDCLHPSAGTPSVDMKLLLATLLFINVIVSTVTVTPDHQETLVQQLSVHQEFLQVGLDLNVISQLEDLCASLKHQQHEPIYELQIQCNTFRSKFRQRQELAAKAESDGSGSGEDRSARSARAQMMRKMRPDSKMKHFRGSGIHHSSGGLVHENAFVLAECRHVSLGALIQGMLRRTPRNIHVLGLLQSIERRKRGVDRPNSEQLDLFALDEFCALFHCDGTYNDDRWKCLCAEGDDCSKDGQKYHEYEADDNHTSGSSSCGHENEAVSGSLIPNECVISVMKCFLNEGGLTYLHNWFMKELENPWKNPLYLAAAAALSSPTAVSVSATASLPPPPFASFSTLLPSITSHASSSPSTRGVILKLTSVFWSFANLLDMNVLPSCHAFSHTSSPIAMPHEADAGNRWISVMIRTAPLSSIRLLSRGGLLSWITRAANKHIATHTLNPCILEAVVALLTTGEIFPSKSSDNNAASSFESSKSGIACPSAIPFVLAVLPAIATDISVDVLRGILPLLPVDPEEAGKALPLLLQTLPSFSEAVRIECLRELVALLNKSSVVAFACTVNHPCWLEHLHALLAASPEKGGGGNSSTGVYELALGFMGMVLHKHFMHTSTTSSVTFIQMFIDALYGCGLVIDDEKKMSESLTRHTWSQQALDLCRRIIESFIAFTSKNSLAQWKVSYSHPAWPNYLSFLTLVKRLCIHNTRSPDFLGATHFSPAAPTFQTMDLVSDAALHSLWKMMENLSLESSGDELAVYGMDSEEAKRTFTIREEARFLMDFFRMRHNNAATGVRTMMSTRSIGSINTTLGFSAVDEESLSLDRAPWSAGTVASTPKVSSPSAFPAPSPAISSSFSSPLFSPTVAGSATLIYTPLEPDQSQELPSRTFVPPPKPPPRQPPAKNPTTGASPSPEVTAIPSMSLPKEVSTQVQCMTPKHPVESKPPEQQSEHSKRVSKLVEKFETTTHYYNAPEQTPLLHHVDNKQSTKLPAIPSVTRGVRS